jgi:hypothetical protein
MVRCPQLNMALITVELIILTVRLQNGRAGFPVGFLGRELAKQFQAVTPLAFVMMNSSITVLSGTSLAQPTTT